MILFNGLPPLEYLNEFHTSLRQADPLSQTLRIFAEFVWTLEHQSKGEILWLMDAQTQYTYLERGKRELLDNIAERS
jgi:hypothetical protein